MSYLAFNTQQILNDIPKTIVPLSDSRLTTTSKNKFKVINTPINLMSLFSQFFSNLAMIFVFLTNVVVMIQ